ncbi:MAG: DNA repair protein RecN [Arachnia sp.]
MLSSLRLDSFGVIAEATLELGPGLTALTGETGAGKTMLVAGLGQLLGGRAEARIVRHGATRALVEGHWSVPEAIAENEADLGGEVDDELISARQVSAQGRSRASLGGVSVPVSKLGSILGEIAAIHGQSEQIRLSTPERQRDILDAYAAPTALAGYQRDWAEHRELAAELVALENAAEEREREHQLLTQGLAEIDQIEPVAGEDSELAREATRLMDADDLRRLAAAAHAALSGDESDFDAPSVIALMGQTRKALTQLAERDHLAHGLAQRADEVSYVLSDIAIELASYATDLVTDPLRLEAVAERRAALASLTRKYGPELADVLSWADQARERLAALEGSDDALTQLRSRIATLDKQLARAAASISETRRRAGKELADAVGDELAALAMPRAQLEFQITPAPPGPHGHDRIELMFTANPGAGWAPLGKVASGGELSRVRLALEVILASTTEGQTFVFDEVDAGVGGAVGLEIGRRLQRLATTSQVIVVTHLAQVAAFADSHFVVAKSDDGHVTTSDIRALGSDDDRAAELARMMSGADGSGAALTHARELLAAGRRPGDPTVS